MLFMFYGVFFGKDGIIYFNKENRREFISESDFKKEFLNFTSDNQAENFKFWTRILNNNVYFEEGSTVYSVWNCLRESKDFWSSLLGIDVQSYLDELEKTKDNLVYRNQYDAIVCFNMPTNKLDSFNGVSFYHIRMNYDIKGYSDKNGIHFNEELALIPLNEIKDLPFYFERVDGVFLEEDLKPKISNEYLIMSEYYKEAKVNDAVFSIFGHCYRNPDHRDNKSLYSDGVMSVTRQRDLYLGGIKSLSDKGVNLERNIKTMKLPEMVSKSSSTVLPYALKRCK